jgi:predicted LPLAT superfamily acyltransferase
MTGFWYRILRGCGRLFGAWFFVLAARIIACIYFLVPARRRESVRFYGLLFPQRSRLFHLWCTYKQFQNFTTIHTDRFLLGLGKKPATTASGWDRLEAAMQENGAILLMSHLGNWEMAARLLREQESRAGMLLYMGVKEKEGVEAIQKEELQQAGIRIIGMGPETNDPLAAIEGIRCLGKGGLVSMSGDMIRRTGQAAVTVPFLGRTARLPRAPYGFALASGAPLFAFFALRTGANRYHFRLEGPIRVQAQTRAQRPAAIEEAARRYAALLEQTLRDHPCQWYHFERFVEPEQ